MSFCPIFLWIDDFWCDLLSSLLMQAQDNSHWSRIHPRGLNGHQVQRLGGRMRYRLQYQSKRGIDTLLIQWWATVWHIEPEIYHFVHFSLLYELAVAKIRAGHSGPTSRHRWPDHSRSYSVVQRQTAVAAHLKSEQLLLFAFALQDSAAISVRYCRSPESGQWIIGSALDPWYPAAQ